MAEERNIDSIKEPHSSDSQEPLIDQQSVDTTTISSNQVDNLHHDEQSKPILLFFFNLLASLPSVKSSFSDTLHFRPTLEYIKNLTSTCWQRLLGVLKWELGTWFFVF